MTTTIRIDKTDMSKSGKSVVIISGGKKYYSKPEQGLKNMVGQTIEAECNMSNYEGNEMWWINAFKEVAGKQSASEAGRVYSAQPIAPWYSTMISNVLGQGILAGVIKEPTDIAKWVNAVRNACNNVSAADDDSGVPY